MLTKSELQIDFLGANHQKQYEYLASLNLHTAMFFLNLMPLKLRAWSISEHGPLDESRHALFILPAIGVIQDRNYKLIEHENDSISISLPMEKLMNIETTASYFRLENKLGTF